MPCLLGGRPGRCNGIFELNHARNVDGSKRGRRSATGEGDGYSENRTVLCVVSISVGFETWHAGAPGASGPRDGAVERLEPQSRQDAGLFSGTSPRGRPPTLLHAADGFPGQARWIAWRMDGRPNESGSPASGRRGPAPVAVLSTVGRRHIRHNCRQDHLLVRMRPSGGFGWLRQAARNPLHPKAAWGVVAAQGPKGGPEAPGPVLSDRRGRFTMFIYCSVYTASNARARRGGAEDLAVA